MEDIISVKVLSQRTEEADSVMFSELCQVFERIEATSKRLEINDILTGYFADVMRDNPDDLVIIVHLCLSRLGPAYEGIELGLGETLLIKAIATATGSSIARIKAEVEEKGDIGLVAVSGRSNQRTMFTPKPLTVRAIHKVLHEISTTTGQNAMTRKVDKVRALFVACQGAESKYLFRLLEGKLRIGLAEQSVLAALAHASVILHNEKLGDDEDPVVIIKSVYKYPFILQIIPHF